jgi:hypothetical protein
VDVDLIPRIPKVWWFGYGEQYRRGMNGFIDGLFAKSWIGKLKGVLSSAGLLRRSNKI